MDIIDVHAFSKIISEHSLWGAGIAAALTFAYKLIRILKSDRKSDDLDELEKIMRNEMREEIKNLKKELEEKNKEIDEYILNNIKYQTKIHQLKTLTEWMQSHLNYCHDHKSETCPLLLHIGPKQFEKLTSGENKNELE